MAVCCHQPFITVSGNVKAMEQLEGIIGTLRVYTSRLATKESYWIFHKDGDDFDLKVSDPKSPSYLLIANDPNPTTVCFFNFFFKKLNN